MCVGVLLATTQYLVAIVPARWFLWRLLGGFSALFNSQTHLYVHACTSYLLDYFLENSIDSYVLVLLSRMNTWSHWKSCLQGWNHLLKRCMVMLASFPDLKNIKGFRNEAIVLIEMFMQIHASVHLPWTQAFDSWFFLLKFCQSCETKSGMESL